MQKKSCNTLVLFVEQGAIYTTRISAVLPHRSARCERP